MEGKRDPGRDIMDTLGQNRLLNPNGSFYHISHFFDHPASHLRLNDQFLG